MFTDIGKGVKDLLEDDYYYTQRLKIKTTNGSQLSWLTEGELSSKGVHASLSASRKGSNLSLDKFRVKNDGRVLFEASVQTNELARFTVSGEDGRQEPGKPLQGFGRLGFELRTPSLCSTADIDVVNGPTCKSSFVYNYQSLSVGAELAVNTRLEEKDSSPELSVMNIAMAYEGPDWNLSARTLDSFGTLRMQYLHTISPKHLVTSRLDYRLKGNGQKLSAGTSYSLDDGTIIKAKIDSNAILAGSFQHKLSQFVKLTLCAEVDVKDWTADSHKFGIGLNFE